MSSIKVFVLTEEDKRRSRVYGYVSCGFLLLVLIGLLSLLIIALPTNPPWGFVGMMIFLKLALLLALGSVWVGMHRLDRVRLTITDTEIVCTDVFRSRAFPLDVVRKAEIDPWEDLQLRLPYGKSFEVRCFPTKARKQECMEEINRSLAGRDERAAAEP